MISAKDLDDGKYPRNDPGTTLDNKTWNLNKEMQRLCELREWSDTEGKYAEWCRIGTVKPSPQNKGVPADEKRGVMKIRVPITLQVSGNKINAFIGGQITAISDLTPTQSGKNYRANLFGTTIIFSRQEYESMLAEKPGCDIKEISVSCPNPEYKPIKLRRR